MRYSPKALHQEGSLVTGGDSGTSRAHGTQAQALGREPGEIVLGTSTVIAAAVGAALHRLDRGMAGIIDRSGNGGRIVDRL